jgi:hypothetical protein
MSASALAKLRAVLEPLELVPATSAYDPSGPEHLRLPVLTMGDLRALLKQLDADEEVMLELRGQREELTQALAKAIERRLLAEQGREIAATQGDVYYARAEHLAGLLATAERALEKVAYVEPRESFHHRVCEQIGMCETPEGQGHTLYASEETVLATIAEMQAAQNREHDRMACGAEDNDTDRLEFIRAAAIALRAALVPQYNQGEPGKDPPLGERSIDESITEAEQLWTGLQRRGL